jgi:predicted RNA-binding Zn ribbon-like protein
LLFAHDTEVFLQAAAALVNTADPDGDQLPDVAALDEFVRTWGWTGIRYLDQDELDSVRELRPRLRQFWSGDLDDVVVSVNQLLAEAHAVPQLVRHDEWDDYHLHAAPDEAPLATRMAVEAAMAISDVIRAGELSRLRVCEYPGCGNVVVDLSRNRSRRYCEAGCGNRAAVAAYRARKVARPG